MAIKTYTPKEQEDLLRSAMPFAAYRFLGLAHRKMPLIIELGIERAIGIGWHQYGDKSWHKPKAELTREQLEEAADGFVYSGIYHLKETGVIPL